jgi:hypothetical protein
LRTLLAFVLTLACSLGVASAQTFRTEQEIRRLVPYRAMRREVPTLTVAEYNQAVRELATQLEANRAGAVQPLRSPQRVRPTAPVVPVAPRVPIRPVAPSASSRYLGRLSVNPYAPHSTANPYDGGSPFAPNSVTNRFGPCGSPFSPHSVTNPFATDTPRLFGQDGKYIGKLSANPFDPESVSNPFGRYGSQFSPDSMNNQFGKYGSRFSPQSPNNPFATTPPVIVAPDR